MFEFVTALRKNILGFRFNGGRKFRADEQARRRPVYDCPKPRPTSAISMHRQKIAATARRFHSTKPMPKFELHKNDCSDFVACVVDEALGVGARRSAHESHKIIPHRISDNPCFKTFNWRPGIMVRAGDIVQVRHSPYYPRSNDSSIWHVGVVGDDMRVYDFAKIIRWPKARYGAHSFDRFTCNSRPNGEIQISRYVRERGKPDLLASR